MPYYALLTYIILTIMIIIWAFLKQLLWNKGTPNDINKFFRLVNFLWLPPLKIYIILVTIVAIIELFKNLFGVVFVKKKDEEFPPAFLFFLNYGIVFCLILYALFPNMKYLIIIFGIATGFITSIPVGAKKNTDKVITTLFPFQLSEIAKPVYNQYEKMNGSKDSHVIEIIWLIIVSFIVIFILILSIIGALILIIILSYFIVFIYTFKIPNISQKYSDTFSK